LKGVRDNTKEFRKIKIEKIKVKGIDRTEEISLHLDNVLTETSDQSGVLVTQQLALSTLQ
jgi:hypothetical protein